MRCLHLLSVPTCHPLGPGAWSCLGRGWKVTSWWGWGAVAASGLTSKPGSFLSSTRKYREEVLGEQLRALRCSEGPLACHTAQHYPRSLQGPPRHTESRAEFFQRQPAPVLGVYPVKYHLRLLAPHEAELGLLKGRDESVGHCSSGKGCAQEGRGLSSTTPLSFFPGAGSLRACPAVPDATLDILQ